MKLLMIGRASLVLTFGAVGLLSCSAGTAAPPTSLWIQFTYRNTTARERSFKPYGIFVGCRVGGKNCDFGHDKEAAIKSGGYYDFSSSLKVDTVGVWEFWPAYYLGQFGPHRWHAITVRVDRS